MPTGTVPPKRKRQRRKPGDPELHMVGRLDSKMAGEEKHRVQARALEHLRESKVEFTMTTMSGEKYPRCVLVDYDQFTMSVIFEASTILFWKHGTSSLAVDKIDETVPF